MTTVWHMAAMACCAGCTITNCDTAVEVAVTGTADVRNCDLSFNNIAVSMDDDAQV